MSNPHQLLTTQQQLLMPCTRQHAAAACGELARPVPAVGCRCMADGTPCRRSSKTQHPGLRADSRARRRQVSWRSPCRAASRLRSSVCCPASARCASAWCVFTAATTCVRSPRPPTWGSASPPAPPNKTVQSLQYRARQDAWISSGGPMWYGRWGIGAAILSALSGHARWQLRCQ